MECQQITSGLAKLGGKVIARTSVRPLTVSDNPNGVQPSPNFAKPPPRYLQAAKVKLANEEKNKNRLNKIII